VQFINVLDFVMVMPLGPDFAKALSIPTSDIGILGGSYAASAAVSGIACSFFLDRFDRRRALAVAMLGLVIGTALGGFASGMLSLVAARVVAGAFGGPATSLALAIVTDTVPDQRRGRALGKVMTAFSFATVLGVPAGLELSGLFGWRAPFFAVAGLGVLLCGAAVRFLPPMTAHRGRGGATGGAGKLLDAPALLSLSAVGLVMLGVFAIVPSLSPYVQHRVTLYPNWLRMVKIGLGFAMRIAPNHQSPLSPRNT
jgi:predicted MFS family arabinose efflux permease